VLRREGLASGTLLDVGGGIGALAFDLLDAGVARASIVEASAACADAAARESARRGRATTAEIIRGDFVTLAPDLPVETVIRLENWRRRRGFRAFAHPVADLRAALARHGLTLRRQRTTFFWAVDVFVRDGAPAARAAGG
jgi:hypothetical protein